MEQQQFNEIIASLESLVKQLAKKREGYKKEPKRRLKDKVRLKQWLTAVQVIWSEIVEKNGKIAEEEALLEATDYYKNDQYNTAKLQYDDMVANIRLFLGGSNEANDTIVTDANNQEIDEQDQDESDEDITETPKLQTVRRTVNASRIDIMDSDDEESGTQAPKSPYPPHIANNAALRQKVEEKIEVFDMKVKFISRQLEKAEQYVKIGKKTDARLALNQLTKQKTDLTDIFEELYFMMGNHAGEYEAKFDTCIFRYNELDKGAGPKAQIQGDSSSLRLKPIEIPKFNGTFKDWPTFSELFKTMILNNSSLDDTQRMQYLKTTLAGEAAEMIANLPIRADKFENAWQMLEHRYENKRAIRKAYLDLLLDMKKMEHETSTNLREHYNKAKECSTLLKDMSGEQFTLNLLMRILPERTRRKYEEFNRDLSKEQTLADYFDYLDYQCQVLETIEGDRKKKDNYQSRQKDHNKPKYIEKCPLCNESHAIFSCIKFRNLSVNERREIVKDKSLCLLCLRPSHMANECKFKKMCPQCGKRHNGLLHFEEKKFEKRSERSVNKEQSKKSYVATTEGDEIVCATAHDHNNVSTLLATALIRIKTNNGWSENIRALIDQGSMTSFIDEKTLKKLKLKPKQTNINVSGIAGSVEPAKGIIELQFSACYPTSFKANVTAVVLNKLTTLLPGRDFDKSALPGNELDVLTLADPDFNKSSSVNMILGADVYAELLLEGVLKAHDNSYIAQETEVGWIISGPVTRHKVKSNEPVCLLAKVDELDEKLKQFWELEEIAGENVLKPEEQQCLEFFNNSIKRGDDGAYTVALPFKSNAEKLGNSKRMAMAQFFQMEKKFRKEPELKTAYVKYINELLENGYMELSEHNDNEQHCYLPHHPVFKESSTTQVRPVFDASRKTSNGLSLNDLLLIGPKLQENLFNILLRFRSHEIAFTADIAKMYLHVKLKKDDQKFQKILWRNNENEQIKEYCLTTVTFGISSSPCLAVATVQHHAKMMSNEYPEACKRILEDSYMDDVSSGCESIEKAIELRKEICDVLAAADFPLRKWASNSSELLETIPEELKEEVKGTVGCKFVKTLGLKWFFEMDKLAFKFNMNFENMKMTKRSILSKIASIYDPLGLLSPICIYNKIIMQEIWKEQVGWDDEVSERIQKKWNSYVQEAPLIEKIKVKRWLQYKPRNKMELHGFSDASEDAMGACVYIKAYDEDTIHTNLVAAKTKVAPTKKVTLPKLELCAAVLLSKLMNAVKKSLRLENVETFYYSDSEITLAWIKKEPCNWKTFVANRVARIQELTKSADWHYINTKANPADIASRGALPSELMNNTLWWYGPSVLLNEENIPACEKEFKTNQEEKKLKVSIFHAKSDTEIISRFSKLSKAIRSIAFTIRYVQRLKTKAVERKINTNASTHIMTKEEAKKECKMQALTTEELDNARITLIKLFQRRYFGREIEKLGDKQGVPKDSKLRSLFPFLDANGIIRVGGRLQNSEFSFNKKHPIIIPYGSHLMRLIIEDAHKKTLHGGNQLTLSFVRQEYWITSAKRAIKMILNKCVLCHRFKCQTTSQLMGNLPGTRTKMVEKAFTYTGTDLCGPIYLKMMAGRGIRTQKGYIVIFICMSTRAIHIEIVTDLTSDAFIAAFKRLIGRRGHVAHLYSDNGTNFIGANKILQLENEQAIDEFNSDILRELAVLNTKFHFNPSLSPWMGGIWERGVGSIKYHLKRTVFDRILSYEELSTVLIQIEAILNSRPITPMSEDPNDLDVLTPGHFLVGNALTAAVEPNLTNLKENSLSKWQLICRMRREFWNKWSNDYISSLQIRSKWTEPQNNIAIGDMVLLKEENTAPLQWPLGRIQQVYPGKDGLVRVVDIKVKGKIYKRPVLKLAKLPILNADAAHEEDTTEEKKKEAKKRRSTKQNKNQKTEITMTSLCAFVSSDEKAKTTKMTREKKNIGRKLLMLIVTTLILLFVGTANGDTAPYTISQFENGEGVFIQKQDPMSIINGRWHLATYVNMVDYENDYDVVNENCKTIRGHCKVGECENTIAEMDSWLNKIHSFDEFIRYKLEKNRKRALSVVSALALSAIGALIGHWTEKTFETMNEKDDMDQILQHQVSVLKMTEQQFAITQNISQQTEEIQWIHTHAILTLIKFHDKQKQLLHMLTNNDAKLSPSWIQPDELRHQLDLISENIPNGLSLIGKTRQDQVTAIYTIATTKTIVLKQSFVHIIEIPLIQNFSFEHLKIIAVPVSIENRLVKPIIKQNHIFIHEEYRKLLTEAEINRCTILNGEIFCDIDAQMWKKSDEICEIQLANNVTANHCDFELASNETHIALPGNEHLYSVKNTTKINIKCGDETYEDILQGNGRIRVKEDCVIETENVKIFKKYEITSQRNASREYAHAIRWPGRALNVNFREKLHETIIHLKSNDNRLFLHNLHHYFGIYIIAIAIIFIVYYFYTKLELAPIP